MTYSTTLLERVELGLIADHSGWARSVRWSCGRPGFKPVGPLFDWGETRFDDRLEAALCWQIGAGIVRPEHTFKVTAV
jgi:hypothetical protein